jgi:hypothetical protein
MPVLKTALHALSVLGLSLWLGGFTFYSALVIPILHDQLSATEAGFVTQRVTTRLNDIGAIALVACWAEALVVRRPSNLRLRPIRLILLAATSALLLFLAGLHRVMDDRLEMGHFDHFYPLHRAYLIASTIQWAVNIPLLLLLTRPEPPAPPPEPNVVSLM